MDNREIIINFKNSYIKNMKRYSDYNDSLFKIFDYDKWKKNLINRSKAIREMFIENEKNISLIRSILDNELDKETADTFYEAIKTFKNEEIHDASIMIDIINKLIIYYEKNIDYDKLINLYNIGALEEMEFFLRMDPHISTINPVDKYMKVLELKDKYPLFKTENAKRGIFLAYYNLIGPIPDLIPDYRKDILKHYKDVLDFYNSDVIKNDVKYKECIDEEMEYIYDVLLTGFYYFLTIDKSLSNEYFKQIDKLMEKEELDENRVELINIAKSYYYGDLSLDKIIDKLYSLFFKYYKDGYKFEGTDENLNTYCNCSDIATVMFTLLKDNEFDEKKKYSYLSKVGYSLLDYINSVPYKDFTSYFDDVSADLFKSLLVFCKNINEKDELLTKLILRRQPITYIHSVMVQKISVLIAKKMVVNNKNIFNDLIKLGYDTNDKIIDYISKAALYHDLGKCLTLGVINLQSRKLTDSEFTYIKLHPMKCKDLLNDDSAFDKYYDVMIGHHRTYDGKGGYPMEFDNVNSPYKSAIDLISIADSIDAATDILGRNYANGKDFYTLLNELNQSKGTRYNPDIVNYINSDDELKEYLNNITGINRVDVYYDVYKKILDEIK